MVPQHRYERRLGERSRIASTLTLDWSTPRVTGIFKRRATAQHVGRVLDISVTGAKIEAPRSNHLQIGSPVWLSLNGCAGAVMIRRITDSATDGLWIYGVSFSDQYPELIEQFHLCLATTRPDEELRRRWRRST